MDDTWLDDHTGDETVPRPHLHADLRAELAKKWMHPTASRRTPWKAIGWSIAAAAAVAGTVVVLARDDTHRIVNTPSTDETTDATTGPTTTPSTGSTTEPNPTIVVVPATGGPNVSPEIVATFDIGNIAIGADPRVAMLPDRLVVMNLTANFRFDGVVHSLDRHGNPLPDTHLAVSPTDMAGLVLGGLDGTLYVETFPEVANTQTTKAYTLDGDTWREVGSYFVEENNDAAYSVSGAGLLLADEVVIPAQQPMPGPIVGYRGADDRTYDIVRLNVDGSSVRWTVEEQFENLSIPSVPMPFGTGAIYEGNPGGVNGDPYLVVLRDGEPNVVLRPDNWRLEQSDGPTALFTRVREGQLEVGLLAADSVPTPTPTDPSEIAIVPNSTAQSARTVLYRAEVGSALDQLGRENCSECDPARPWSPLLTDGGLVIIPDTVNARWVVVDNGDGVVSTVPLTANIVGQPLLVGDTVYVPQTAEGSTDVRIAFYSLTYLQPHDPSFQPPAESVDVPDETYTQLLLNGDTIEANGRPAVTGLAPAHLAASTIYAFDQNPNTLTTSYGGRTYHWTLPAGWAGAAVGAPSDGTVVFTATHDTTETILRVLPDGTYATEVAANSSDGFNSNGTVSTMGYVRLEFVSGHYEIARYPLPQPNTWAFNPVNGSVAGFALGPQQPDDVIAAISKDHGAPSVDTGWATLVDPNDPSNADGCPYGQTDRIVRWGDLTVRFWQREQGAVLWAWTVGDLGAAGYPSQADPGVPLGSLPSGLRLDNGIRVGSTLAEVQAAWPDFRPIYPQPDGSAVGQVSFDIRVLDINMRDGVVIGFGMTTSFC